MGDAVSFTCQLPPATGAAQAPDTLSKEDTAFVLVEMVARSWATSGAAPDEAVVRELMGVVMKGLQGRPDAPQVDEAFERYTAARGGQLLLKGPAQPGEGEQTPAEHRLGSAEGDAEEHGEDTAAGAGEGGDNGLSGQGAPEAGEGAIGSARGGGTSCGPSIGHRSPATLRRQSRWDVPPTVSHVPDTGGNTGSDREQVGIGGPASSKQQPVSPQSGELENVPRSDGPSNGQLQHKLRLPRLSGGQRQLRLPLQRSSKVA